MLFKWLQFYKVTSTTIKYNLNHIFFSKGLKSIDIMGVE